MSTMSAGNYAEAAVAEELTRRGYEIVCLNWKTKSAEIDVVAKKDGSICFVEVKYRRTAASGDGFEAITYQKLHHMQRAAETYVQATGWWGGYELLAASVSGDPDGFDIDIREI